MSNYRKVLPCSLEVTPADWDLLISQAQHDPASLKRFINRLAIGDTGDGQEKTIDHRGSRPLTIEELAELYGIDLERYECIYVKPNVWSIGTRVEDPVTKEVSVLTEPLYQSKASFRPKKSNAVEDLRALIAEVSAALPAPPAVDHGTDQREYAAEICIFDHHLGKVGVDEEWGVERSAEIWREALDGLLDQLPMRQISKFYLPCGNDFLHVDGSKGMTYNGTPVGDGGGWFKMVLAGKDLLIETIERLAKHGDVVVPFISGNHDRDSTFSIGEMVAERFRNYPNVRVINTDKVRIYCRYGTCLIGWSHGDTVRFEKIANLMAMECPMDYAQTTYRTFHIGHLHHRRRAELSLQMSEHVGVDVEIIPSLSPKDRWHEQQGYMSSRRATAFLYHAENGLAQQIWHNHKKDVGNQLANV